MPDNPDNNNNIDYDLINELLEYGVTDPEIADYRLSHYGREREQYLIKNNLKYYAHLGRYSSVLKRHLIDVDKRANELEDKLFEQMVEAEGLTHQSPLKKTDPLKWAGLRNNIAHTVRDIVREQIIYV